MKHLRLKAIAALSIVFMSPAMTSCLDNDDETIILEDGNSTGIPDDSQATPNPIIDESTTSISNFQYTVEQTEDGLTVIRLDLTGVQDQDTKEWMKLYGTGSEQQNVWVEVDGKPKGILVHNNSEDNELAKKIDLVFLVDNSGSMSEEADAIARDIISWSQNLANSGLDVRFGCVGYNGLITGGINITGVNELSNFLNRSTGTNRTMGFVGNDANTLSSAKYTYDLSSQEECGAAALRFADEHFSFRTGANRIYVNFTDEPNYPHRKQQFSVEYFKDQQNWNTSQGTVHTVYSDTYTSFSESTLYEEYPWKLSEYTGGTIIYTSSSFMGVTLDSLPVTGAMQNSYIIKFTNVDEFMDGQTHRVKITIMSKDGRVKAEREFDVIFGTK